jgi:polysaccharide pyruvyl transferase WcaK-like protein
LSTGGREEINERFWEEIASSLPVIAGCEISVLSFSSGKENDADLCSSFANQLNRHGHSVNIQAVPADAFVAASLLTNNDLVVACRYHAAVLSYLVETPTVIIPYHQKLRDFVAEVQLPLGLVPRRQDAATVIASKLESIHSGDTLPSAELTVSRARELANRNVTAMRHLGLGAR